MDAPSQTLHISHYILEIIVPPMLALVTLENLYLIQLTLFTITSEKGEFVFKHNIDNHKPFM